MRAYRVESQIVVKQVKQTPQMHAAQVHVEACYSKLTEAETAWVNDPTELNTQRLREAIQVKNRALTHVVSLEMDQLYPNLPISPRELAVRESMAALQ